MSSIVSLVDDALSNKTLFLNELTLVEFGAHRPFQETMLKNKITARIFQCLPPSRYCPDFLLWLPAICRRCSNDSL